MKKTFKGVSGSIKLDGTCDLEKFADFVKDLPPPLMVIRPVKTEGLEVGITEGLEVGMFIDLEFGGFPFQCEIVEVREDELVTKDLKPLFWAT